MCGLRAGPWTSCKSVAAILSGALVALLGMHPCAYHAPRKAALNQAFAALAFVVGGYMLYRNLGALPGFQRHASSVGT